MISIQSAIDSPIRRIRRCDYQTFIKTGGLLGSLSLFLAIYMPLAAAQTPKQLKRSLAVPNAAREGPFATASAEYRFEATVDPDILSDRETEIWAVVHRPAQLPTRSLPIIIFLHGNHETCGTGSKPRIDDNTQYSYTGTCPENYVVVPNHRGYDYLGRELASWGYLVVSINANRGINGAYGNFDDPALNLARGRLVLKHLQLLSIWNNVGGTPASLGVDLRGKLNFNDVGLMGHSRGGEGVRAAYNLYRDADSPWLGKILNQVTFKGIFEIAPVDGQTNRVLNADGVAWNALLSQCDGDVWDLQGVRVFDRMLGNFQEYPATSKSTYTVWGANHNYYNTEWQTSDSNFCMNHEPIFRPGPSVGSKSQQNVASGSLMSFMRGNIFGSVGYNPIFSRHFNPQFILPKEVTEIARIDRGYTSSSSQEVTAVVEDFDRPSGTSSRGFDNIASNINIFHGNIPEHDFSLQGGNISWSRPGEDVYFQTNLAKSGQGINLNGYKTLDLRLENQYYSASATDFEVAFVKADGQISTPVPISRYVKLRGPVGGPGGVHAMLQTARIPLDDFEVSFADIQGVRIIFNKTPSGALYVANIRLSSINELGDAGYSLPEEAATNQRQTFQIPRRQIVPSSSNKILSIRRVTPTSRVFPSSSLRTQPLIEIEVSSDRPFPVRNQLQVLRIGQREFLRSRYPTNGDTKRLVFTLTEPEFHQIASGEETSVQYGRGQNSILLWNLGRIDKSMLR